MKKTMTNSRPGASVLFVLSVLLVPFLCAAKTFDVDISTGRPAASNEAYYHGETIEFRAVRGRSVVTNVEYSCVYYQTNGMGDAWWHTDGLTFHPTNDVGASAYRFFLEGRERAVPPSPFPVPLSSRDWHANGLLRLLDSPGFEPNALPVPVLTLDFSKVEVLNAPWPDESDVCSIVTNTVNLGFSGWTISGVPEGWVVASAPEYIQAYGLWTLTIAKADYSEGTAMACNAAEDALSLDFGSDVSAARQRIVRNALGLARLSEVDALTVSVTNLQAQVTTVTNMLNGLEAALRTINGGNQ